MSIFDILDKEERQKKPSIEELYGYEDEQMIQDKDENFLDRIISDIKQKQQKDSIRARREI